MPSTHPVHQVPTTDGPLVIVSSPVVKRQFQLKEAEQYGASVGETVMTPGDLARRLHAYLPRAPRVATPTQELQALWLVLKRDLPRSPFSVSPVTLPGFLSRLLSTLRQLKQFDLHGYSLDRVTRTLEHSSVRERWDFVSRIYSAYDETLLHHNLLGEVGLFHHVARHIRELPVPSGERATILLHHLVDFTPAQAALFSALCDSGYDVRLCLPNIPAIHEPVFEERIKTFLGDIKVEPLEETSPDDLLIKEVVTSTPSEETRWCARFARGLVREGAPPHSIFVSFRRSLLAPPSFRRHFADFGITLAGEESARANISAKCVILALADLAMNDFPRWAMSVVLSAYRAQKDLPFSLLQQVFATPTQEQISDEELVAPVIWRGYERWRARLLSLKSSADVLNLFERIRGLRGMAPADFVATCRQICADLLPASESRCEGLDEGTDMLALLLDISRDAGAPSSQILDVLRRLEFGETSTDGIEPGRIGWASLPDIPGISVENLILLGMTDSEVPAPLPSSFILSLSERSAVNSALNQEVFLSRESHMLRERLFLESALAGARSLLIVSRHQISGSRPQYETPLLNLWKGKRKRYAAETVILTMRRSLQPKPTDVESVDDFLRASAVSAYPEPPEFLSALESRIARAVFADLQRITSRTLVPDYDGILSIERLPDYFRGYGRTPETPASPSTLTRYGQCPFIFFAEKGLGLVSLPEEDAPPTTTLGSLMHEVLERAIQPIIRSEATWESFPVLVETAIEEIFGRVTSHTFAGNLQALRGAIVRFAAWEAEQMMSGGGQTTRGGETVSIQPLRAECDIVGSIFVDGESLHFKGRTDRIDRVSSPSENHPSYMLTDYKSSRVPTGSKPRSYLQLPLYVGLLASQIPQTSPADFGYRYLSVARRKSSPSLSEALRRGALASKFEQAVSAAEGIIQRIRKGIFAPFPQFSDAFPLKGRLSDRLRKSTALCDLCSYLPLCRISLMNGVRKNLTPFALRGSELKWSRPASETNDEDAGE
ncbi:MAG: PD-(D/E)XK nuclease family protein [bacterium JZ-2024 1]